MKYKFEKWHGCQNDFLVILTEKHEDIQPLREHAENICTKNGTGIGADGILAITQLKDKNELSIINKDGSLAGNCGNGLRCAAGFLLKNEGQQEVKFHVLQKEMSAKTTLVHQNKYESSILMPSFSTMDKNIATEFKDFANKKFDMKLLDHQFIMLGNPHLILEKHSLKNWEFFRFASELQNIAGGINVHLIQEKPSPKNNHEVSVLVYERGVGATPACGSGACAVAKFMKTQQGSKIKMPGGLLKININGETPTLSGPAEYVYSGEIQLT